MNALMVLEALVVLLQDPCSERLSLHVHLTRSARTSREVISCSKFLDQLKKFVDEAGSSSVVQLLPNLPSSVKKWESPAREVLGSTEQCSDKYWVIFGSHTVLQHIGG